LPDGPFLSSAISPDVFQRLPKGVNGGPLKRSHRNRPPKGAVLDFHSNSTLPCPIAFSVESWGYSTSTTIVYLVNWTIVLILNQLHYHPLTETEHALFFLKQVGKINEQIQCVDNKKNKFKNNLRKFVLTCKNNDLTLKLIKT